LLDPFTGSNSVYSGGIIAEKSEEKAGLLCIHKLVLPARLNFSGRALAAGRVTN